MSAIATGAPVRPIARAAGVDGLLDLRLRPDPAGRTALVGRRQRFPLRTTVAMRLDERDPSMAFVYVQNPTGGVFAGDRLRIDLVCEPGARVHLTTQSATRLCRSDTGEPGVQELRAHIGANAYVEHVPDALIPHAGARYQQRTEVDVATGSVFLTAETIAPGRAWECFDYAELDLRNVVRVDGRVVCVDAMMLRPGGERAGVLGTHRWLVTLLVVVPGHDGEALAARIDARLALHHDAVAAAGALPHRAGVLVRAVSDRAPAARRALRAAWCEARSALVGLPLPPVRK